MKRDFILLAIIGIALCSCKEDIIKPDDEISENINRIVYASTEGNDTKTSLSGNDTSGYEVLWSKGDEIAFDEGNTIYALVEGENTTNASFEAKATPASFNAGEPYEAVYPASFAQSKSWPSSQIWNKSITQVPMSAAGISDGTDAPTLAFKNLGGLLRVRINASDALFIDKIEISSDDPLAGPVLDSEYSFTSPVDGSEITVLDPDGDTVDTVTLDCGDGVEIAAGESKDFWFALPASVTTEKGAGGDLTSVTQSGYHNFKIKIFDASGKVCTKTLKSEDGLVIERSKITTASFSVSNSSFDDTVADYLCFTSTSTVASEITLCLKGSVQEIHAFEYSYDGQNWLPVVLNTTKIVLSSSGDKVYFRTSDDTVAESFSLDYWNKYYFSSGYTYSFKGGEVFNNSLVVSGNVMSLLDKTCETTVLAGDYCFVALFSDCYPLVSASDLKLPATTLTKGCYTSMFSSCSYLEEGPVLPATVLADNCYSGMFNSCSKLVTAPELNVTKLAPNCYNGMFLGCSSLEVAPELPATALADSCYHSMFRGTAIKKTPVMKAETMGKESCCMMYYDCKSLTEASDLEAKTLAQRCYYAMFRNCTSLTAAPAIKAETLAESCCYSMFDNCTSLVEVPALPKAALAPYCYQWMFSRCKKLVDIPELPSKTLVEGCYYYMFESCSSIKKAPVLPAEELAPYCYQGMFNYCSSLEECPELIAEEMVESCYANMFEGCSSITEAAELPSLKLAPYCYEEMFADCDNLLSGPELPATKLEKRCYAWMFLYCDKLEEGPELPATTMAELCYYEMFYACPNLKTAPALPATVLAKYCYEDMFSGCRSLQSAPDLPATELAEGCYSYMFSNCTALTDAPVLPATTLAKDCYNGMFNRCSSLSSVEVKFTSWNPGDDSVPTKNWLNGVAEEGTFTCPSLLPDNRGVDYIPANWTLNVK